MGLSNSSLVDTRVYAQDVAPNDTRDGVLWVDTSVSPRDTYVYSSDSASWEGIIPTDNLATGHMDSGAFTSDGTIGTYDALFDIRFRMSTSNLNVQETTLTIDWDDGTSQSWKLSGDESNSPYSMNIPMGDLNGVYPGVMSVTSTTYANQTVKVLGAKL